MTNPLDRIAGALERIAAALEAQCGSTSEPHSRLLPLIAEFAGPRAFNTAELVQHAALPENVALRAGINECVGPEHQARRLSAVFKRAQKPIAGIRLERIGRDRDGAIWRVVTV